MIKTHNTEEFMDIVNKSTYKNLDIREAIQYGALSVQHAYANASHEFARYYTISFDDKIMITIMLERCGNLVYYVTVDFTGKYAIRAIKELKRLARLTVKRAGAIMVRTADFYTQAKRFNKIIGFKPYKIYNDNIIYILE